MTTNEEYKQKEIESKFKRLKNINEEIESLEKNKPPANKSGAMQGYNANMGNLKAMRTDLLNRINKLTSK